MEHITKYFYLSFVVVVGALLVQPYVPVEGLGGSPLAGLWGVVGAFTKWNFDFVARKIQSHEIKTKDEAKRFNEQLKLLSATINALSITLIVGATAYPLVYEKHYQLFHIVILFLGVAAHIYSQKVLSYWKSEEQPFA